MQEASEQTVLGDFNDSRFEYAGKITRFYRENGEFRVTTEGPEGTPVDYRVAYVFGVSPLQQYLIPFPGGRLQALSIAWDTRPADRGGQRWFHLYPEQKITAGDPLHWTGPYQNWNLQCAECHSTNLLKRYDDNTRAYSTTWSEIDVACEACHGPGARHVSLAGEGKLPGLSGAGFPVKLGERGVWHWPDSGNVARRGEALDRSRQVENCGRCHSRRGTLGDYHYGQNLLDTHRVSLLHEPLYYVDGQILDEVYVYGSFVQSKMYRAGVVCSNCHEPHSNELRAPGNGVCAQCHRPSAYDSPGHHRHTDGSPGAACVNCHMPSRDYMVIDPRRDHSMRVPRPDLSIVTGTPNACTQCHRDESNEWALDQLRGWDVEFSDTARHPARHLAMLRRGNIRGAPALLELARDPQAAPIWRATALVELGNAGNRDSLGLAVSLLGDEDPMLRWSAVQALTQLPLEQRYRLLAPLMEDDILTVRMEVARSLATLPPGALDQQGDAKLQATFREYESVLQRHADVPESQLQLGLYFAGRQNWEPAERAYRRAIDLNPQLLAAYLNMADLYRTLGREDDGRVVLLGAIEGFPEQAAIWHALGLLEVREGNREAALGYLQRASALEQEGTRMRYVYAIALHDSGQIDKALGVLRPLLREAPDSPDLLMALASYSREAGRREDALRYAGKLRALLPGDRSVEQFYDSLQ
jgi:predicted CXXCH cytochrome family protein